jgi:hypothetical protein
MQTLKRTSLPLLLILLAVLACGLPDIVPLSPSPNGTAVAQTVLAIVQMTQRAAGTAVVPSDTLTPSLTATLAPPTFTPAATLSPTPIFTITPLFPAISVSVPTNCRVGPGKIYEMVGALLVGETVQVYGRDPTGNYWYIRNPDSPSNYCWVWGQYATLTGLTSIVPILTPPPTPTATFTPTPSPAFDASFSGLESCSGWWVDIDLENTGSITFRSINLTVKDTDTSTVVADITDGFVDQTGCSSTTTKKALAPGKVVTESSPTFSYDPSGHKLKATITLCSDTGLGGTCVTQTISFKP